MSYGVSGPFNPDEYVGKGPSDYFPSINSSEKADRGLGAEDPERIKEYADTASDLPEEICEPSPFEEILGAVFKAGFAAVASMVAGPLGTVAAAGAAAAGGIAGSLVADGLGKLFQCDEGKKAVADQLEDCLNAYQGGVIDYFLKIFPENEMPPKYGNFISMSIGTLIKEEEALFTNERQIEYGRATQFVFGTIPSFSSLPETSPDYQYYKENYKFFNSALKQGTPGGHTLVVFLETNSQLAKLRRKWFAQIFIEMTAMGFSAESTMAYGAQYVINYIQLGKEIKSDSDYRKLFLDPLKGLIDQYISTEGGGTASSIQILDQNYRKNFEVFPYIKEAFEVVSDCMAGIVVDAAKKYAPDTYAKYKSQLSTQYGGTSNLSSFFFWASLVLLTSGGYYYYRRRK